MKTERKKIRPDYYDEFSCIAGQCPITCCQEWKIAVDADTNRRWRKSFRRIRCRDAQKASRWIRYLEIQKIVGKISALILV